jgi:hypothetical protein
VAYDLYEDVCNCAAGHPSWRSTSWGTHTKETLAKAEHACAELLRDAEPVTCSAVTERAGISRTTLYRDENLRAVVEEHRQRGRAPRTLSGVVAEVRHLRDAVAAI